MNSYEMKKGKDALGGLILIIFIILVSLIWTSMKNLTSFGIISDFSLTQYLENVKHFHKTSYVEIEKETQFYKSYTDSAPAGVFLSGQRLVCNGYTIIDETKWFAITYHTSDFSPHHVYLKRRANIGDDNELLTTFDIENFKSKFIENNKKDIVRVDISEAANMEDKLKKQGFIRLPNDRATTNINYFVTSKGDELLKHLEKDNGVVLATQLLEKKTVVSKKKK